MEAEVSEQGMFEASTDKAPRKLRIVAYLFWLAAAGALFRMEVVNVLLFAGIAAGLLTGSRSWRLVAVLALALACLVGPLMVAVLGYRLYRGAPGSAFWVFGINGVRLAHVGMLLFTLAAFALALWQLCVLYSGPVKAWFAQSPYPRLRVTKGVTRMLIVLAVVGLVLGPLGLLPGYLERPVDRNTTWASSEGARHASYGFRFGRLAYVVFVEKPMRETLRSPVRGKAGDRNVVLETPDGRSIPLPNATQLYEIRDGELHTSSERVTGEQLKAFLKSSTDRYTVDALLAFARSRPATPTP